MIHEEKTAMWILLSTPTNEVKHFENKNKYAGLLIFDKLSTAIKNDDRALKFRS